jgi:hypothetical protein
MGVQLGQSTALYCRVSTADQSCERQEQDLAAFAARGGYDVAVTFKPHGRMMATAMAGIAEFERELTAERIRPASPLPRRGANVLAISQDNGRGPTASQPRCWLWSPSGGVIASLAAR